eukprot:COSAG05_NODE_62_length_23051_cov_19.660291_10_plen_125_part_00
MYDPLNADVVISEPRFHSYDCAELQTGTWVTLEAARVEGPILCQSTIDPRCAYMPRQQQCDPLYGWWKPVERVRGLEFISLRVWRPKLESFSVFRQIASAHYAEESQYAQRGYAIECVRPVTVD